MGISKSKQKTTSKSTETGSVTPTNPDWVTDSLKDWTGKIGEFGDSDPYSYVPGASALQQQAWGQAGKLGGWQEPMNGAMQQAGRVSGAPNLANRVSLNGPSMVGAEGYNAPQLGNAANYNAPRLGEAATYNAPEIAAAQRAQAEQGAKYMGSYLNPYTDQVVNTTLEGMDENAGQIRAQQAAQAASNNAFGGSRFALREAQTEGEIGRARASAEAGLRSNAFNTAAGLGMADADRFGATSQFNAAQGNQRNIAQAGMSADALRFGADARNQFGLAQAGFDADASRYDADARNQFRLGQANLDASAGQFNAGNRQAANMANAGYQNQFALSQGQMDQQNNQFNAGQGDVAQQRMLAAAGVQGDLANSMANNQRGDLGLLAGMGDQQRMIEQQRAMAPMAQLEMMGQLYGTTPFGLFSGKDMTGTTNSTSTTTARPSLFSQMMAAGEMAAKIYTGGMSGGAGGAG